MLIWCLGCHDRLRLVVIRFLRSSLMPLKVGFRSGDRKGARSLTCLGTRFTRSAHWQQHAFAVIVTRTEYITLRNSAPKFCWTISKHAMSDRALTKYGITMAEHLFYSGLELFLFIYPASPQPDSKFNLISSPSLSQLSASTFYTTLYTTQEPEREP